MDWLKNNFEIISLVLFIVLITLMVIFLIYISHVSKFFSSRKFKILGLNELDVLNDESKFVIRIFNNNVNNTAIAGFGFKYKEQTIDFYNTYFKEKGLDKDESLIIATREYFTFNVNTLKLEDIILNYDKNQKTISTIYTYVIDSQGALVKTKAKTVRKVISNKLKAILKAEKEEQLALKKAELARLKKIKEEKCEIKKAENKVLKAEKKAKCTENRLNRQDKRRAKWQRFKMKVKDLFTKKPKDKKNDKKA